MAQTAVNLFVHVFEQAGRMGKIALEKNIGDRDASTHHVAECDLFKPECCIHLLSKVFARQLLELRATLETLAFLELIVEGFQGEGNPAYARLDGNEAQIGKARQHTRYQQVAYLQATLLEKTDRLQGVLFDEASPFHALWVPGDLPAADV